MGFEEWFLFDPEILVLFIMVILLYLWGVRWELRARAFHKKLEDLNRLEARLEAELHGVDLEE